MKNDQLKQFIALRESLIKEQAAIEARLAEIKRALSGEMPSSEETAAAAPAKPKSRRVKNPMSLKAAVKQVTSSKALSKEEILDAVQKLGYRFATTDPMNSLNTVLYSGKDFKNVDGKFTLAEGKAAAAK